MTRVLVVTAGSRGDVQPFLALTTALRLAGYDATLATHAPFRSWSESYGAPFIPLEGDIQALLRSGSGREAMKGGTNPIVFFRSFMQAAEGVLRPFAAGLREAIRDADLLIYSFLVWGPAQASAASRGIPGLSVQLQPFTPSRSLPPPFVPVSHDLPRWINAAVWQIYEALAWGFVRKSFNAVRGDIFGVAPLGRRSPNFRGGLLDAPSLHAYSPIVVPKPREWAPYHEITGYWFLPAGADWQPEPRLQEFLAAGPPPVYVGFGSMTPEAPGAQLGLIVGAARQAGTRAIVASGWSEIAGADLPDEVFLLGEAPHDWLFPRMAGVIHHGGAGTTAAALRAGVPQLICPFLADQPFWGHRVRALGVGPEPILHRRLTVDTLAAGMRALRGDPTARSAAAAIGRRIRAEDGVQRAVEVIGRRLQPPRA